MQTTSERLRARRKELQTGFTLIELLIIVAILGILASIVVFATQGLGTNSAKGACAADFKNTETALESYKAQMGGYPNSSVDGNGTLPATDRDPAAANATAAGGELLVPGNALPNTMTNAVGPWLKDAPVNARHYTIFVPNNGSGVILVKDSGGSTITCPTVN
jgi:general secretion pathway protein G